MGVAASYAFPARALRLRALPVDDGRAFAPLPDATGMGSLFRRFGAGAPTGTRDSPACPKASAAACARVRTPFVYDDDIAALTLWVVVAGVADSVLCSCGGEGESSSMTMTSLTRPELSTVASDLYIAWEGRLRFKVDWG